MNSIATFFFIYSSVPETFLIYLNHDVFWISVQHIYLCAVIYLFYVIVNMVTSYFWFFSFLHIYHKDWKSFTQGMQLQQEDSERIKRLVGKRETTVILFVVSICFKSSLAQEYSKRYTRTR